MSFLFGKNNMSQLNERKNAVSVEEQTLSNMRKNLEKEMELFNQMKSKLGSQRMELAETKKDLDKRISVIKKTEFELGDKLKKIRSIIIEEKGELMVQTIDLKTSIQLKLIKKQFLKDSIFKDFLLQNKKNPSKSEHILYIPIKFSVLINILNSSDNEILSLAIDRNDYTEYTDACNILGITNIRYIYKIPNLKVESLLNASISCILEASTHDYVKKKIKYNGQINHACVNNMYAGNTFIEIEFTYYNTFTNTQHHMNCDIGYNSEGYIKFNDSNKTYTCDEVLKGIKLSLTMEQ